MASTVSIPYSLLLFYLVRLQGSFLLVWLIYIVSLGIGIGVCAIPLGRCLPRLGLSRCWLQRGCPAAWAGGVRGVAWV